MNYIGYSSCDLVNGEGLRCVLWCTGCNHRCTFCQSKMSWKFSAGLYFDEIIQEKIIKDLKNPFIDGITLSGGDSMHPRNVISLLPFVQRIKKELPDKTVWCYTGYTFEQLKENLLQSQFLSLIDILIDGKFVKELYEPDLLFRGSSQQRIIDVQKSLTTNKVCLYLDGNYK